MLEGSLRMIGLGTPVLYATDPDCGYLPKSEQHVIRFFANNTINQYGMRCDEIAPHKAAGALRIMFVGDSVTYGTTYVDQASLFTEVVKRELPDVVGRPVEVLNCSAGGWGIPNEVGFVKSRGTFDADMVVFVLNTSDPLQGPGAFTPDVPGSPTHNPMLATQELWSRYIGPRLRDQVFADTGSTTSANPPEKLSDCPLNMQRLCEARDVAAANHAGFAVLFVPFRGKYWDTALWTQGHAMLADWCQSNHVPLMDMTDEMKQHDVSEIYFEGGVHMRPAGHQVVAEHVKQGFTRFLADARRATDQLATAR